MKTTLMKLLRAIVHQVSQIAATEAGELLSARRKWHLLEAERYTRMETGSAARRELPAPSVGDHRLGHRARAHRPFRAPRHA